MKFMKNILLIIICIILISSLASAFIISPAIKKYSPEEKDSFDLIIKNTYDQKTKFVISTDSDYVSLEKTELILDPGVGRIKVYINSPKKELLNEGDNIAYIMVTSYPSNKTQFGGGVVLKSKIDFFRAFEGPHFEPQFDIRPDDAPLQFTVSLENLGTKSSAKADVIISSQEDAYKKIEPFELVIGDREFDVGEKGKLVYVYEDELPSGVYEAKLLLNYYDFTLEKKYETKKLFTFGNPLVEMYIDDVDTKGITKITSFVKLDWNLPKEIYLTLDVYDDKVLKFTSKTPIKLINPYEKTEFSIYVEGMTEENYDLVLNAYDDQNNLLGSYTKKITYTNTYMVFVIVIIILLIIVALRFYLRKKK